MPTTILEKDTKTIRKNQHHPKYNVILWNDDVNDMYAVIEALCLVVGIKKEQAYVIMMTAHNEGKALVITCELEHAEFYAQGLKERKLQATIEEA